MRAEQNAAQSLAGQKRRRGALDAQPLDQLAPLALELLRGKEACCASSETSPSSSREKFAEPAEGDRAGVRAGVSAEVRAHAAQVFFDLAAGAALGAGAHHRSGDVRESRSAGRAAALPLRK